MVVKQTNDCIFCKIAKNEIPSKRIYENESFFSILDQNQRIKGHALIISKKHFGNILDLPQSLGSELLDAIKNTAVKVMKNEKASGFNILSNNFEDAGQVVKHLHMHIFPRKKGDGIKMIG